MIDIANITEPIAKIQATYLTAPSAPIPSPAETTQPPMDSPDNRVEHCREYIGKLPPSVSGESGHDRLLQAACECVRFGLTDTAAMDLMREYNSRAVPPWDEKDIERKLSEARKKVGAEAGSRLRDQSATDTDAPRPVAVDIRELIVAYPKLRDPLIEGILRKGETLNLISAAKAGKTYLAMGLAISLSTGKKWLDRFRTTNPGPVLYVDCELHPETFADRIGNVCAQMHMGPAELAGKLTLLGLRGYGIDIKAIRRWCADNRGEYSTIFIDAWYRVQPEGTDENSNSDTTRAYNVVDQIAKETGAAVIVVHHMSKGNQSEKSIVDAGAGASAMARAADSHLILRPHEQDRCYVLDLAARSWPPLDPICLRWEYPLFRVDETLDPADLKKSGKSSKAKDKPADDWTPERFAAEICPPEPTKRTIILTRAEDKGISGRMAQKLITRCEDSKLIIPSRKRGENAQYYALAPNGSFAVDGGMSGAHPPTTPNGAEKARPLR